MKINRFQKLYKAKLSGAELSDVRDDLKEMEEDGKIYQEKVNSLARRYPKIKERYRAEQVVRTEEKRIETQEIKDDAETLGVKKFKIMTQSGACEDCIKLSQKIYTSNEIEKDGVSILPHHPNCLCLLVPIL